MIQFDLEFGMARDLVLILRSVAILLILYLSGMIGKRIKEAGPISSTTGFMLYLVGFACFQMNFSFGIFYSGFEYNFLLSWILMSTYFVFMAGFSFFEEYDEQKHLQQLKTKKFPYQWTIISIIGVVFFVVLMSIDPNLSLYAFLYLLIPFGVSSRNVFKKFLTLEIFKQTKADKWFSKGLALSGLSNFIFIFPGDKYLLIVIQVIAILVGAFCMTKGWQMMPPLSELQWYLKLDRLLVLQKDSSLSMFSYKFQITEKKDMDDLLAGGALSGIQSILKEVTSSEKGINEIDHGDTTIYFRHSPHVTFVLFSKGKSQEFLTRLGRFAHDFVEQYGKIAETWNGDAKLFESSEFLIKKHFTRS